MRGWDEYVFSLAVPGLLLDVHSLLHFNDSTDDKNEYSNIQWGHSDPKCADIKQSHAANFCVWMTRLILTYIYIYLYTQIKEKGWFQKKKVVLLTSLPTLSLFSKYHAALTALLSINVSLAIMSFICFKLTWWGWWKNKNICGWAYGVQCSLYGTIKNTWYFHQNNFPTSWSGSFNGKLLLHWFRLITLLRLGCWCRKETGIMGMAGDLLMTSKARRSSSKAGKRFFIPCTMSQ